MMVGPSRLAAFCHSVAWLTVHPTCPAVAMASQNSASSSPSSRPRAWAARGSLRASQALTARAALISPRETHFLSGPRIRASACARRSGLRSSTITETSAAAAAAAPASDVAGEGGVGTVICTAGTRRSSSFAPPCSALPSALACFWWRVSKALGRMRHAWSMPASSAATHRAVSQRGESEPGSRPRSSRRSSLRRSSSCSARRTMRSSNSRPHPVATKLEASPHAPTSEAPTRDANLAVAGNSPAAAPEHGDTSSSGLGGPEAAGSKAELGLGPPHSAVTMGTPAQR
mmetsp:Transcript_5237/g.12242  ORF Transcript_5237/g.12242 Transcript_5237/m.12242 type:complete len:288 (+) Transcript_5237:909-1772(+)